MKLYLVRMGNWDGSCIKIITDNIEMAKNVYQKQVKECEKEPWYRWIKIEEAELNKEYIGMEDVQDLTNFMKIIERWSNHNS